MPTLVVTISICKAGHSAILIRDTFTTSIAPCSTEVDLVLALSTHGIDLREMQCLWSQGTGFDCVSVWWG